MIVLETLLLPVVKFTTFSQHKACDV